MARKPRSSQPDFIVAVGRRFQALRKAADLTQEELAVKMGADKTTVSRFETGAAVLSMWRLFDAARAMHRAPAEFFGGDAPEPESEHVPADAQPIVTLWARLDQRHRRLLVEVARSFAEASASNKAPIASPGEGGDVRPVLVAEGAVDEGVPPKGGSR